MNPIDMGPIDFAMVIPLAAAAAAPAPAYLEALAKPPKCYGNSAEFVESTWIEFQSRWSSTQKHLILPEKFHTNIKSSHYVRPKSNALQFTVVHYAGLVTYDARGFLEKNRNHLPTCIIQLLNR